MNENHRLIKDVSNALGFYMNRTRREEGFDLSGILRPAYDLNQFKFVSFKIVYYFILLVLV